MYTVEKFPLNIFFLARRFSFFKIPSKQMSFNKKEIKD